MAAPKIEQQWACVADSEQTALAAQLSSYFNEPGVYFPVFEFPAVAHPYEEVPTTDTYFAQILGRRAATHINNCMTHIQPRFIILMGLTVDAQTYIRAIIPKNKLVVVNTLVELLALPFAAGNSDFFRCKPAQAIQGLIAAKSARKPLTFEDDAPDLPMRHMTGKKGLVVLENPAEVGEVSIVNYASAIDVDIVLVDPIDREKLQSIPRQLQAWAADHSSPALLETRKRITDGIRDIDFKRYEFATFFTAGLPYGLILQNVIPFTHVANGPFCSVFITNAIIEENSAVPVGNAVLFSLDEFKADETGDIARKLAQNNFLITALIGKDATNANLSNYGSHLPYDLLHICSHGGETPGYFVKQEFVDRDGKPHVIEFFEIVSFSPAPDPDNLLVESKMIFTTLDGMPWVEHPLALYPNYVSHDMMQALRDDKSDAKRIHVYVPIALSCHIKCHESFHQGHFHYLAAHAHPIIFNNSCSSSHEMATGFSAAGARCYIATLWSVGESTAMTAALAFYTSLLADGEVITAFSSMLRAIRKDRYRDIYILWGLHFTSLARPATKNDANIIAGLLANYAVWTKRLATSKEDEIRRSTIRIIRFLVSEIQRRASPQRAMELLAGTGAFDEQEAERSHPATENAEVTELIITKEINRSKARLPSN